MSIPPKYTSIYINHEFCMVLTHLHHRISFSSWGRPIFGRSPWLLATSYRSPAAYLSLRKWTFYSLEFLQISWFRYVPVSVAFSRNSELHNPMVRHALYHTLYFYMNNLQFCAMTPFPSISQERHLPVGNPYNLAMHLSIYLIISDLSVCTSIHTHLQMTIWHSSYKTYAGLSIIFTWRFSLWIHWMIILTVFEYQRVPQGNPSFSQLSKSNATIPV